MKCKTNPIYMLNVTSKERQVLALVSMGLTTKEIAGKLNLSHHTIESHRKNLLRKYEAKNSAELIHKTAMSVQAL